MTVPRAGPDGVTVSEPTAREPDLPDSLVALVERSVRRKPGAIAMRWLDPGTRHWSSMTYAQLWDRVRDVSLGLASIGVGPGDRVLIFSRSRPEWAVADLAALALGAVTCPIYSGEGERRLGDIVRRIGARVAFVENPTDASAIAAATPPHAPEHMICLEPSDAAGGLMSLDRLAAIGASASSEARAAWEAGWRRIGPDDVATVVQALGRGGESLGAVLTHRNVLRNFAMVVPALALTEREVVLSILPLSHMLERGTGLYVPLGLGASVAYAPPSRRQWADAMRDIRPTALVVVPLLLDRLTDGLRSELRALPAWQRALVMRAMRLEWRRRSAPSRWPRLAAGVARATITARIRSRLGGRLRFVACGGSALRPSTGRLLTALGIPVVEGYGLTETAPLVSLSDLASPRFGTVGRPLPGTSVRIEPLRGEVLVSGEQVMLGYLDDPAATARALDADGWFRTGDLGRFEEDGHLVITGQLKPVVVLASGKKVASGPIEAALRASPLIADATIAGRGEAELRAAVTPDLAGIRAAGLDGQDDGEALRIAIEREIQACLAGFARYERPRLIRIEPPAGAASQPGDAPSAQRRRSAGRTITPPAPNAVRGAR